jgi:hypothetical protein
MPLPGDAVVQSIKLTVGAWTVMAKASAVNPSTPDFVRCQIYDNTNNVGLDGATYQLGNTIERGGTITNLATIVVPEASTVQVQQRCGHDTSAGNGTYIDADASIVGFLTVDGTAAGQTELRTASQTPLTATDATVLSLPLAQGSYAIGFKTSAVTFGGDTRVFCSMTVPSGYAGGISSDIGSPTAVATNAFFTYLSNFNQAINLSVTLKCRYLGASGAYLDPGTVLWARKVKAVTAAAGGCGTTLVNGTTDLVAVVRPGASCAISSSPTTLSQAFVTKGTWVAVGGESSLINNGGADDYMHCELTVNGGHLDGSAAWEIGGHDVGVTLLGTAKTTGFTAFTEACHRDSSGQQSASIGGGLVLIRV